ncbi:MAG TPA: class I SAM-dependent methyltransferase [Polyangiaceae bacterium]|nr:class I SAM-dependent methyltransferase [Polyangiaceae bacterium]
MNVESVDYFSNHRHKLRFPWSLYHRPIVRELDSALSQTRGARVLNIGSGPFFERAELACAGKRFTLCDIDTRAVELARTLHGDTLESADVIAPRSPLPYAAGAFDAVVSMDVIEHVQDPLPWLCEAVRVLSAGGLFFVTTPNYASPSLRMIENTVLEAVARSQGFSRRRLHPTKLDALKLNNLLARAGVKRAAIKTISHGWVLAAYGWK